MRHNASWWCKVALANRGCCSGVGSIGGRHVGLCVCALRSTEGASAKTRMNRHAMKL